MRLTNKPREKYLPHLLTIAEQRSIAKELHQATEKALLSAYRMRRKIAGAVNWADLSANVQLIVEFDDYSIESSYWNVIVEEAAPESTELCKYVAKKLPQQYRAWVTTEW